MFQVESVSAGPYFIGRDIFAAEFMSFTLSMMFITNTV